MVDFNAWLPEPPHPRKHLLNAELRSILLDLENRYDCNEGEIALSVIRAALDHVCEKDTDAWLSVNRALADITTETVDDVSRALAADRT